MEEYNFYMFYNGHVAFIPDSFAEIVSHGKESSNQYEKETENIQTSKHITINFIDDLGDVEF